MRDASRGSPSLVSSVGIGLGEGAGLGVGLDVGAVVGEVVGPGEEVDTVGWAGAGSDCALVGFEAHPPVKRSAAERPPIRSVEDRHRPTVLGWRGSRQRFFLRMRK